MANFWFSITTYIRSRWRGLIFMGFCFSIASVILFSALNPFRPWSVESIDTLPTIACADDPIQVLLFQSLDTAFWQRIYMVNSKTYWYDVGRNTTTPVSETSGPPPPDTNGELRKTLSPVDRRAPQADGKYKLIIKYEVKGSSLVFPASQTLEKRVSLTELVVLDDNNVKCS